MEKQLLTLRWDELESSPGREFASDWLQVDDEHVDLFERGTYTDANEHAMDPGIYAEGLVEGFHLLALLDHLVNSALVVDHPDWGGWNYGFDHVRFVSEVTTHDRIRAIGAIRAVEAKGPRFLVTLTCAIEVEGRERPGVVTTWKVLWTVESGGDR